MALFSEIKRCNNCGSSDVLEKNKKYFCNTCGILCDNLMNAADIEKILTIQLFGGSEEEISYLRKRYSHLDIVTWSNNRGLEIG